MVSVKTLMLEEMSKTHNTKVQNKQIEGRRSESGRGILFKGKNKKKREKSNVDPRDKDLTSEFGQYNSSCPPKRSSTEDLAEMLLQFHCGNHRNEVEAANKMDLSPLLEINVHRKKIHLVEADSQLSEKYFILEKALSQITNFFLSQKLADPTKLIRNVAFQSKEFIDALEILNSNKELLMMLNQDPDSLLLRHIQDIKHAFSHSELLEEASILEKLDDSSSNEPFQSQSHNRVVTEMDKPKGNDCSRDISTIVFLKPVLARIQDGSVTQNLSSSPLSNHSLRHQEEGERTKSYFSLKGIKRKLRHVIGDNRKQKHPTSMDGLLDRVSLVGKTSGNPQETSQSSGDGKKKEKAKLNIKKLPHIELCSNEETKLRLIDAMSAQVEKDTSPSVSTSLEISLPEYNSLSPKYIPGSDEDRVLSPRKIILSPSSKPRQESFADYLSPLKQNIDEDDERHVTESKYKHIAEELMPRGVALFHLFLYIVHC